jgi:heme/copper-type cytochrome/quinol oxidase subunit 2
VVREYEYSNAWLNKVFDRYMVHDLNGRAVYHSLDIDNRLTLPTSTKILFLITSVDVLHA